MAISYVQWQREELKVGHPDAVSPEEVRALLVALFESGRVPPYSATGERQWGAEVEATSGRYRVLIRRDTVTVELIDNQEQAGGRA